jgi:hypothetical protein
VHPEIHSASTQVKRANHVDIDGQLRPIGGAPDAGADETSAPGPVPIPDEILPGTP